MEGSPYWIELQTKDLFWAFKFRALENISGKSDLYLEIISKSAYFEYCTADILITLEHRGNSNNLSKYVRNIELCKEKAVKVFVKSVDDAVKFFRRSGFISADIIFTFSNIEMSKPIPLKE